MDANGYNTPMTVSPATGQTRPEILQDAMGGTFDEETSSVKRRQVATRNEVIQKITCGYM
jgi:hypothetical protein